MWESRVLRRAFERLELHEGKLSRAVLRGGGGGDVTSLPDTWVGNHPGLPGPRPAGVLPGENRLTLQGHGLWFGKEWRVYWWAVQDPSSIPRPLYLQSGV